MLEQSCHVNLAICLYRIDAPPSEGELTVIFYITLEYCMKIMLSFSFTEICQFQQLRVFLDNIQTAHWLFQCDKKQIKLLSKFGSCGVETDITVFFYLFNQLHFGSHPSFNFSLFISKVVVDGSH